MPASPPPFRSRKRGIALGFAVLALACGGRDVESPPRDGGALSSRPVSWTTDSAITVQRLAVTAIQVDTVASGVEVPWAGVFTPAGDLLFTERNGRIRVVRNGSLLARPLISMETRPFDDMFRPENGLTGIALAPDYVTTGHIFVLAAYSKAAGGLPRRLMNKVAGRVKDLVGTPTWQFENRLLRLRVEADSAVLEATVVAGMPTNHYHAGGFVHSGPDGMLYFSVGDGTYPRVAQKERVLAGKILRMDPGAAQSGDGRAQLPFVFASGLRNSQGMAWHPESGSTFAVDHGPTGMHREKYRTGNDELNVIVPGGNYGWPIEGGEWGGTKHLQPIRVWGESIAPSGIVSLPTGDANRAELVVSSLRAQALRWLTLRREDGRWRVVEERILLEGVYGRLRVLAAGPDGSVYVGTSNRDGRGAPRASDDLLLRIVVANSGTTSKF